MDPEESLFLKKEVTEKIEHDKIPEWEVQRKIRFGE